MLPKVARLEHIPFSRTLWIVHSLVGVPVLLGNTFLIAAYGSIWGNTEVQLQRLASLNFLAPFGYLYDALALPMWWIFIPLRYAVRNLPVANDAEFGFWFAIAWFVIVYVISGIVFAIAWPIMTDQNVRRLWRSVAVITLFSGVLLRLFMAAYDAWIWFFVPA